MRVVMLLHKSVEHDGRVRREAGSLRGAGHEVVVVHLPRGGRDATSALQDGYELRSATPGGWSERLPGPIRRAISALRIARVARRERPDIVHAHDAAMLVPGRFAARGGARLVYDSHELATGVPYRSGFWAGLVAAIERLVVPRCDAVITVSDGIAERLRGRYGLAELPTVVRNVPDVGAPGDGRAGAGASPGERAPADEDLRNRFGVGAAPLILHHGAVAADRGGENLIRSLAHYEGAHLLFLGAEGPYADRLERLAAELGLGSRVHFHPPVPLSELLAFSSQADVGVTLLEDTCENHRLALPNKAFEYVAAGLPVVASDLPELRALIERHGIGWTVDPADPAAIAATLTEAYGGRDDPALSRRLAQAAEELRWSNERSRLVELYDRLAGRITGRAWIGNQSSSAGRS